MTRSEKAMEYFMQGANCAQAVTAAFADLIGVDERAAFRMAAPFGGGRFRGGDGVLPADGAIVDGLHDQQQRHHLGYRGRGQFFVGIFLVE